MGLSKKIKKFGDWYVTTYGLETLKPYHYFIDKERLQNKYNDGTYDWPQHMSEKNWNNNDDFIEAFGYALKYFFKIKFSVKEQKVIKRKIQLMKDYCNNLPSPFKEEI
jgi:hypothetical protein